ncbi:Transcription initiation factor TFIID subunit 9 [Vulpes lagopus]
MESGKMASPKSMLKDAQMMAQILKDMGITENEPRFINQMLEFAFQYVTTILDDAKIYSSHAKKATVDADDVRLVIQCRADQSFTSPPPRDFFIIYCKANKSNSFAINQAIFRAEVAT